MSLNQILSYITIGILAVFLIGGLFTNNIFSQPTVSQEPVVEQQNVEQQTEVKSTTVSGSIINNGTFDEEIANDPENPYRWWIWQASDYNISNAKVGEYGVKDGYAYIKIKYPGGETWHIQFNQWIKLE
ncbi:MAG: hypothetical protein PWP54_1541, partial [Thermosipho sp. (in: thermotogales)]|nr:hypothetical protein [Thermosipho sp. (in: thermotogales)]